MITLFANNKNPTEFKQYKQTVFDLKQIIHHKSIT
jgi:hypothetical protein